MLAKATDTHTECVILTALPLQQWLQECATVLRCTYNTFACAGDCVCSGQWPDELSVGTLVCLTRDVLVGNKRMLRSALLRVIAQRVVVISYRRFGTAYLSHLSRLKMGPIGCLEASVRNPHYWLHNNPEA